MISTALNRKLPIQHGSGTKDLTGKKELNRRDDYSSQLLVIVPSLGFSETPANRKSQH
jgi:hypothetical protein